MPAKIKIAIWVVITSALVYSAWSLYYVARKWGAPPAIALISSLVFDGLTIASAHFALRHTAERASGGRFAWFVTIAAGAVAVYLNAQHAALDHHPAAASVLYAFPSAGALALLIIYARYRRAVTRPRMTEWPDLPRIRSWSWVLHPAEAWSEFKESVRPDAVLALAPGVQDHEHDGLTCSRCGTPVPDPRPALSLNGSRQGAWSS
jgi:hypothetical protein